MNVRIRCSCTESNGNAVSIVRWYDPTGTKLVSALNTAEFNANVPHFTRVGGDQGNTDNTNVILVIPTFNDSYDGTYTCGGNAADRSALSPPTAAVTLIIGKLIINRVSYLYVHSGSEFTINVRHVWYAFICRP